MEEFFSVDRLRIEMNSPPGLLGIGKATESEVKRNEVSARKGPGQNRTESFEMGRLAAHRALVDVGREPEPIARGSLGEPLWPPGVVGSITHSSGTALSLVASRTDALAIGIDLEHTRSAPEIEGLVAFGDEVDWLATSVDALERQKRLLELFSAKETVYKALSPLVGRYFGFESARLHESENGSFTVELDASIGAVVEDARILGVSKCWFEEQLVTWLVIPAQ